MRNNLLARLGPTPARLSLLALLWSLVATHAADVRVWFSPRGGCTEALVQALEGARTNVLVQAYSFTSIPIAQALVKASRRGVKVSVILDKSQERERYSSADFMVNSGLPTYVDRAHAIAHNKVMIIDGHLVVSGSFNFTKAAEEQNAENLLLIEDPALASQYALNWSRHLAHSKPYVRKTTNRTPSAKPRKRA